MGVEIERVDGVEIRVGVGDRNGRWYRSWGWG